MASNDAELAKELEERIDSLLNDELLHDVPENATIEEIDMLISVERGQAFRIKVDRSPLSPVYIMAEQASKVQDIKKLIQAAIERQERGQKNCRRHISWKYIWQSHCLVLGQERLVNDQAVMSQIGISQGSVLRFSRVAHEKGRHQRARRWHRH